MGHPSEKIINLLSHPEAAAKEAHLTYVSEEDFSIKRIRGKNGFNYRKNGKPLTDSKTIKRIEELVIPPAWREVKICPKPNGHLQVVGKDIKNRKQYLYHPLWTSLRNNTKFYKMFPFGKKLPKIRKQVDKDLDLPEMTQRKIIALVIRLMEETHIRIGNDCYAKRNKSYGLSTFRSRHVEFSKGKMEFHYMGKSGKEQKVSLQNKKLIKLVGQCEEISGWEIFKYYDDHNKKQTIDSEMVNNYIQEISGDIFSAKDFRTWGATIIFFEKLREIGYSNVEKENKANILTALDATATALGNTRSICRNSYVHPMVLQYYESGKIETIFEKVARKRTSKPYLSQSEEVLLHMLEGFKIKGTKK